MFRNSSAVAIAATIILISFGEAIAKAPEPLWAHAPSTISPEWGPFLKRKGKGRQSKVPAPDDVEAWKKMQAAGAKPGEDAAGAIAKAFDVKVTEAKLGGVPVLHVTPARRADDKKIVVYTHGGAYVLFSARSTLNSAALFARATGLKVISIDYTLAPHSKWRQTTDEVVAVFRALLKQGYKMKDIAIYGDSAGGGLAAGSVLKMRDLGMGMPGAVVLWSPWADITETGDTYATLRDAEPTYTYKDVLGPSALAYADTKDQKNPYVSPVYGDFSRGFPPTLIQGGTKEIFLSNFVRLYQALDTAGATVKLDLYEGMPHVFQPQLPNSPESRAAMAKVGAFLKRHFLANAKK